MRAAGLISMVAAASVSVAAGTAGLTLAPAAAQQAGPTVTIEPATDLVDGTPVSVSVSGLRPHAFVEAVQCAADRIDVLDHCDFPDSAFSDATRRGPPR